MAAPLQPIAALLSVVHLVTAGVATAPEPPLSALEDILLELYQIFYELLGDAYDMGKPLRDFLNAPLASFDDDIAEIKEIYARAAEHLEEKKEKLNNDYNVAKALWDKMELSGKSEKEKVENIVDVLSAELWHFLPVYTNIQSMEDVGEGKYTCGNKGIARDLTKIKQVARNVEYDGSDFKVEIDFTIEGLQFVYTVFYVRVRSMGQEGRLYIDFGENLLRLTLRVSSILNIPQHLASGTCIVQITNFKVEKLDFLYSKLKAKIGKKRYHPRKLLKRKILSNGVRYDLRRNQEEVLRQKFERAILAEIHKALTTKNDFVCKDKRIVEELNASGGSTDDQVFTDEFTRHCGADEAVEPYKE